MIDGRMKNTIVLVTRQKMRQAVIVLDPNISG